ncbi:MAG TPA: hypothetical protein VHN80_15445 [Kineosporiaceae bacterium]|nr:hypothetical protein [Kineosporiaceae bacterium]
MTTRARAATRRDGSWLRSGWTARNAPVVMQDRDLAGGALTAQADARVRARREGRRVWLRLLGLVVIVIVAVPSIQGRPAPGLYGRGLAVAVALATYVLALATASTPAWIRAGAVVQAVTIVLIGAGGVALAALQPHGPVELAASVAVWVAVVRLPLALAAPLATATVVGLAVAVATTQRPVVQEGRGLDPPVRAAGRDGLLHAHVG